MIDNSMFKKVKRFIIDNSIFKKLKKWSEDEDSNLSLFIFFIRPLFLILVIISCCIYTSYYIGIYLVSETTILNQWSMEFKRGVAVFAIIALFTGMFVYLIYFIYLLDTTRGISTPSLFTIHFANIIFHILIMFIIFSFVYTIYSIYKIHYLIAIGCFVVLFTFEYLTRGTGISSK